MTLRFWAGESSPALKSLLLWAVLCIVPVIPYTLNLFQQALSNSPTAYLIWIPVVSLFWASWNLVRSSNSLKVTRATLGLGLLLCLSVGIFWTLGMTRFESWFIPESVGLLLWPLWALGLLRVMLGSVPFRAVVGPLAYWLLVWPPIYLEMLNWLNPFLARMTAYLVHWVTQFFSWIHMSSAVTSFDVLTPTDWVTVIISNACSGSDSILALLVLFPITLILFRSSLLRKSLIVILGCVLAFLFNIVRIAIIVVALHVFGFHFAFDIVHPLIGPVFFIALVTLLLLVGSRSAVVQPGSVRMFATRGRLSATAGVLVSLTTALALSPMYTWSIGSQLKPLFIKTSELAVLLPNQTLLHEIVTRSRFAKVGTDLLTVNYVLPPNGHVQVNFGWRQTQLPFQATPGAQLLSSQRISIRPGVQGQTYVWTKSSVHGTHLRDVYRTTAWDVVTIRNTDRRPLYVMASTLVKAGVKESELTAFRTTGHSGRDLAAAANTASLARFGTVFTKGLAVQDNDPTVSD